ncbi:DUF805 domain-containing protein [Bibersteinia trehalosi]|uniref:DUF805 domain-containing protein n=1 Tax=Bibersteinia trehalosi TaxID=47735 RepID=UPI002D79232B|nr:DUF805 domain-containing protein [Bibersteinia trehalosi]
MNWFILALRNIFNFQGRARRKEYGWFMLIYSLIHFVLDIIEIAAETLNLIDLLNVMSIVNFILFIWFGIVSVSLTTRRLHDVGHSGWWQLLPLALSLVVVVFTTEIGTIFSNRALLGEGLLALILLILLFYFAFFIYLLFKDGQRFNNKYGADPKAVELTNSPIPNHQ